MTPYDQARLYLDKVDPAISGDDGHGQTFRAACILVHGFGLSRDDARALMLEYNQRCQPPWSEKEIEHKLGDAERAPSQDGKPRGWRCNASQEKPMSTPRPAAKSLPEVKSAKKAYALKTPVELPKPIADGARELLRAAFLPGEGICIASAMENDEGHEVPKDGGCTLSLEEWLRRLDKADGNPNEIGLKTRKGDGTLNGIFIRLNPMRLGGAKDEDVTAYRHALVEWDNISAEEQWNLITQSKIPVTAVIASGGKSLHAWVKVDAANRREFDDRVKILYDHFEGSAALDGKNKNPSRLSRLANCARGKKRQELLALNIGAESFGAWLADLDVDGIGEQHDIIKLRNRDNSRADPNCLIGNRWLNKRGSCLFVGQSGIGKSSLMMQMAITWSLGGSFFGISPVRPLRSLIFQAENDEGDLSEAVQGVMDGLGIARGSQDEIEVAKNVIPITEESHTGEAFGELLQRRIDKHRPDVVWIDPALAVIGDDISKQVVCAKFFRHILGRIAKATGVAWMIMHHTTKPPTDSKARQGWKKTDYSYVGAGSSDLTNWARAGFYLHQIADDVYALMGTKREDRHGAKSPQGFSTKNLYLKHATDGAIRWDQCDEPEQPERESKGGRQKTEFDAQGFVDAELKGNGNFLRKHIIAKLCKAADCSERTADKLFGQVKPLLDYDEEFETYKI